MKELENVNIIYVSNDGYAGHLGASLYSLLENNRHVPQMAIYIFSVGMSGRSQERLRSIADAFRRQLRVMELGDLKKRFPYELDTRGFDISAMGRLFAPTELDEDVKKALYLDCDTIVRGSIEELYGVNLGEDLAGMVMEPTAYCEMKEAIGFGRDEPYFNSGAILMDLAGWRRERILPKMLEFYGMHRGSLFACDQDTINGVLKGRIRAVPPKYNFFTNYRYFRYRTLKNLCGAYGRIGEAAFREAKKSPVIVHFAGDERPWIAGNHNAYRKEYLYYLSKTPWRGSELQKGKWLYMQLWCLLNQVTRVCPALRLAISKKFGMRVIDGRRREAKKKTGADGGTYG